MGFDERFLGVGAALPRVTGADAAASVSLDYVHFTVVLDSVRRLARVTGVNIDGASLLDLARGDDWRFDERVPEDWQTGPAVYAANDLDRGHLVRRRDPVWGTREVATRANSDTFHFTNAAPQAGGFNQSEELWLGLEDHVLEHAEANRLRLSVFTAPVLGPDDPPYRGIRIPLRFWKIAAWNRAPDPGEPGELVAGELAAAGFVLDQSPLVDTSQAVATAPGDVPPLGPFRAFQVPIADIAAITGLAMPDLMAADVLPQTVAAAGWRRLAEASDILL